MCVMSRVIRESRSQFPPIRHWPVQPVQDMTKVIELLERIDKKLGAKDCIEETKDDFLTELRERLEALEGKAK